MTLECNSSSFKSYLFSNDEHWARNPMRAACVHHGTWDGLWKHMSQCSSALHATKTHVCATSWTDESSDLVPLSTHCQCGQHLALYKIAQCRSAVHSKFTNCQVSQTLEWFRNWKFHNVCSRTHTFRLCENLETRNLTKNRGIRRLILSTTIWYRCEEQKWNLQINFFIFIWGKYLC